MKKSGLIISSILLFFFVSTVSSSTTKAPEAKSIPDKITIKVLLGELTGASIKIYRYPDIKKPVFSGRLPSKKAKVRSQITLRTRKVFKADSVYLITIAGGQSLNIKNRITDPQSDKNKGKLHAIVSSTNLKTDQISVSAYTEILYQRLLYLLSVPGTRDHIINSLKLYTLSLIDKDINNDKVIDYNDILSIKNYKVLLETGPKEYLYRVKNTSNSIVAGNEVAFSSYGYTKTILKKNKVADNQLIDDTNIDITKFNRKNPLESTVKYTPYKKLSDPALLGNIETKEAALRVHVDGKYLYVNDMGGNLLIYDISENLKPTLVSNHNLDIFARHMNKLGDILIVAGATKGVQFINVADPNKPVLIKTLKLDGDVCEIKFYKGKVIAGVRDGKYFLIDIADPENPTVISDIDMKTGNFVSVTMRKNLIYLSINSKPGVSIISIDKNNKFKVVKKVLEKNGRVTRSFVYKNYLFTSEFSNKTNMYRLNKNGFPGSTPIKVLDTMDWPNVYQVKGDRIYIASENYISVYQVSNAENPVYLGNIANRSANVAFSEKYAYVASWRWGVNIIPILPVNKKK